MKPFDDYPQGGYTILPKLKGGNARRNYGHWLVGRGQTSCAYCGMCLVDSYEHWLLLTVDHVIPVSDSDRKVRHRLGIPRTWHDSYSNIVLACSGCNGYRNRCKVSRQESKESWEEFEFFKLRDTVFQDKKGRIKDARIDEKRFYKDYVVPLTIA